MIFSKDVQRKLDFAFSCHCVFVLCLDLLDGRVGAEIRNQCTALIFLRAGDNNAIICNTWNSRMRCLV